MHTRQLIIIAVTLGTNSVWGEDLKIQHPTVTKCCPSGYGLLSNHSCVPYDTGPLAPLIHLGEDSKIHMEIMGEEQWNSTCGKAQVLKQLQLGNESQLHLFEEYVFLYWLSPDADSWVFVELFCLAMSADTEVSTGKSEYVVEFCYRDPVLQWREDEIACQNATCIRKCCSEGQIFNGTCAPPEEDVSWQPVFHSTENLSIIVQEPTDLLIVYGIPECPVSLIYDEFVLLESGKLEMQGYDLEILANQYCLELFVEEPGRVKEKLVLCHEEDDGTSCWWRHLIVDTLFMSISCVFLAITWLIYVCVSELRTNTHGRCMISFISAIFVAFVTILVNRNYRESFSDFSCSLTAILSHMSILATFFWLSVLSYHIWDCLRSGRKRDEKRVFVIYCIYGWGCPLLIALVGAILDATQAQVLRPDFQTPHCWFKDRMTKWLYLYGFKLALLIVNLGFFVSSVVMVTRRLRQTQDMRQHSDGLWLYLKLFIIMGITWIIEMITWLFEENSCETWVSILDGITALHGVYIFLVTVLLRTDVRIFRRFCGKTKYDVDGNTVSCTRDNFVELLDGQSK